MKKVLALLLFLSTSALAQAVPKPGPPGAPRGPAPIPTCAQLRDSVWMLYRVRREWAQAREESAIYQRAWAGNRDSLAAVRLRLSRLQRERQVEQGLETIRRVNRRTRY